MCVSRAGSWRRGGERVLKWSLATDRTRKGKIFKENTKWVLSGLQRPFCTRFTLVWKIRNKEALHFIVVFKTELIPFRIIREESSTCERPREEVSSSYRTFPMSESCKTINGTEMLNCFITFLVVQLRKRNFFCYRVSRLYKIHTNEHP